LNRRKTAGKKHGFPLISLHFPQENRRADSLRLAPGRRKTAGKPQENRRKTAGKPKEE
jgi:hypothetical protein